jgi:hypothetical protein
MAHSVYEHYFIENPYIYKRRFYSGVSCIKCGLDSRFLFISKPDRYCKIKTKKYMYKFVSSKALLKTFS